MNEHQNSTPALVYNGEIINQRAEMLSLTDMWKAAGSPEHREPFNWARKEGAGFIEAVAISQNLPEKQVMAAKPGKGGGTFAHWQVALAYAKYLSHDFHMWCNTVVRERMEGRPHGGFELDAEARKVIGGIIKSIVHSEISTVLPTMVDARLLDDPRRAALDYVSVRQMLDEAKALSKRRNGLNRKCGRDLARRASLTASSGKPFPARKCPHTGVWLYQRDFAAEFMRERGNALVADHNAAVMGQGVIPFPVARNQPARPLS